MNLCKMPVSTFDPSCIFKQKFYSTIFTVVHVASITNHLSCVDDRVTAVVSAAFPRSCCAYMSMLSQFQSSRLHISLSSHLNLSIPYSFFHIFSSRYLHNFAHNYDLHMGVVLNPLLANLV